TRSRRARLRFLDAPLEFHDPGASRRARRLPALAHPSAAKSETRPVHPISRIDSRFHPERGESRPARLRRDGANAVLGKPASGAGAPLRNPSESAVARACRAAGHRHYQFSDRRAEGGFRRMTRALLSLMLASASIQAAQELRFCIRAEPKTFDPA